MIKQIIFKSTKDFNKEFVLDLSKHINVIIGPKGGGKSTLFDLVAGIKNKYICKRVIQALSEYNLKFDHAICFNGEIINATQLAKKSDKERDEDYKNRNDVIYQNDPIKNDLTSFKEIDDDKFKYVVKQVAISEDVDKFILEIKNLYYSFNNINNYNKNIDINWSNTFRMVSKIKDNHFELITSLDYNPIIIEEMIIRETNDWILTIRKIDEYNSYLLKLKNNQFQDIFQDPSFDENISQNIEQVITKNNELLKQVNQRLLKLKKAKELVNAFANAYKLVVKKINNKNHLSTTLKTYETKAKNHFKNLANGVFRLRQNFEKIISKEYEISIKNDLNQNSNLTFHISEKILFSTDEIIEILKTIFHTPGSSVEDVTKWLKSLVERGIKDFNDESIKRTISKIVKKTTKVLVDEGKDYESLSLGQRSIYGLRYKFNKSLKEDLFLDQPEDNLDNKTIANDILKMIEHKKEQQLFIVTHNANIGILSKPENVIIANLLDVNQPYKSINFSQDDIPINYLEGGREFLEQRYLKVFKEIE